MKQAAARWTLLAIAFLVVGPLCAWLLSSVRGPDGGDGATLFLSESPLLSTTFTLLAIAVAAAVGRVTTIFTTRRTGLFAAGLVLWWAARSTATVEQVLRRAQSPGAMFTLALEGLILGAAGVAAAWFVVHAPRRDRINPDEPVISAETGLAIITAATAGAIGVWAIAQEALKQQALAAAIIGAVLAATVGRVLYPRAGATSFVAAVMLVAVIAPALAVWKHGDAIVRASYANELLRIARVAPLDWLAGAFLGIPLGLTWAGSLTDKRSEAAEKGKNTEATATAA